MEGFCLFRGLRVEVEILGVLEMSLDKVAVRR